MLYLLLNRGVFVILGLQLRLGLVSGLQSGLGCPHWKSGTGRMLEPQLMGITGTKMPLLYTQPLNASKNASEYVRCILQDKSKQANCTTQTKKQIYVPIKFKLKGAIRQNTLSTCVHRYHSCSKRLMYSYNNRPS